MKPTLPESLLSRLSDMLASRIGLHFPTERWGDLERGLAAAAPDLGMPNAIACANHLLGAPLTHREIEILASHLTIGETYFFREPQSFEAIEQHILPALLRRRADRDRRLRIWSAGCCTGEEPYSIAMLLDRMIPDAEDWHITLLATDINPTFLRKAAEGEYGEWSFRGTPDWIRRRYFHPTRNGRFRIDDRIRRRVTFSYLNLADDAYPSLLNNTNAMDIIFCRNVLMYFNLERVRAVLDKFRHTLLPDGWLLVSPAEVSGPLFTSFTAREFPGATLYRRPAEGECPQHIALPRPIEATPPTFELAPTPPDDTPTTTTTIPPQSVRPATDPALTKRLSELARQCANEGRLDEAGTLCQQAIAADKLNPVFHYLLSTIRLEQGQNDHAIQSLSRTLYLDPDFILAHYTLGMLRQGQGRRRDAQRHFDMAIALLRTHSPDSPIPESDGLPAARLTEIIETMCTSMPERRAAITTQ